MSQGIQDIQSSAAEGVSLHSVSFEYPGTARVLDSLTFKVEPGEFVAILGPSGCGKSTLLRLLAAFDQPTAGAIQFENRDPFQARGFVFQESRLLPWLTALENVKLPFELSRTKVEGADQKALAALDRVGLSSASQKYPAQLSGGMKMRVSVARALVTEPRLLLLDEPFASVDEQARQLLQYDLRRLWQSLGMTVLFVTHSLSEAVFLSNRILILSRGPAQLVYDHSLSLPHERTAELRSQGLFTQEIQKMNTLLISAHSLERKGLRELAF